MTDVVLNMNSLIFIWGVFVGLFCNRNNKNVNQDTDIVGKENIEQDLVELLIQMSVGSCNVGDKRQQVDVASFKALTTVALEANVTMHKVRSMVIVDTRKSEFEKRLHQMRDTRYTFLMENDQELDRFTLLVVVIFSTKGTKGTKICLICYKNSAVFVTTKLLSSENKYSVDNLETCMKNIKLFID